MVEVLKSTRAEEEKGWAATLQLQAQKDGILIENTFMLHAYPPNPKPRSV